MLKKEIDHWLIYATIFIAPIVVYFFYLSSFPLTYDELRSVQSVTVDYNWLRQGRWGMFYLNMFYSSNPVLPFVGIYISSVLCGIVVIKLFLFSRRESTFKALLFSLIVFLSYPSLIYFYDFSTISYSLGFIYILTYFSVLYFLSDSFLKNLIAILALTISIALYQSSLTVFIVMFMISLFFRSHNNLGKLFLKLFIGILLSIVIYYFSVKFFVLINNVEANSYVSSFVSYKFDKQSLLILFTNFFHHVFSFYTFSYSKFISHNYFLVILLFFSVLFSFINHKKIIPNSKIVTIFKLLVIILCPFTLNLLSPVDIPTRTLIALPLAVSFLSFIVLSHYQNKLFIGLSIFSVLFNIISVNKLSFVSKNAWNYDQRVGSMMIERIYNKPGYTELLLSKNKIPVHLVGFMGRKENQYNREIENIGKSFFSWGNNELLNVARLFNTMGFDEFRFANPLMLQSDFNQIRDMPNWPENGSVRIISGAVVIKVSDYSEAQVRTMCSIFKKNNIPDSCLVTYNPQSIKFSIQSYDKDMEMLDSHILKESRLVNARYRNGVLFPLSSDSQIILPNFNNNSKNSEISLSIKGDYEHDDTVEIYFKRTANEGYSANNMIRINILASNPSIIINLPSYLFKNGLRVDPSNHKTPINNFSVDVNNM
ncbi:glucosyltransferase domain-containing protein [Vibrio palustris]|uniref:Phosphoglycerol transferase I n=1 Tax=Vibrio palustris TaxID=1918946 RepID=A0A1R4B3P2_9VIBR|nr:glucosyltransferase domain-containing protein [Vibrio palustris]SJL83532.1 hypothetical protein VPAL9027_01500 [Vibrio palustris]